MLFDRKEYNYSLIETTSKEALKRSALLVANYDIKKATEIYDYFAKDMPDLPTKDPIPPSTLTQVRDTAVQLFQWGRENQDQIVGVTNMVLQLFGKGPIGSSVSTAAEVVTEVPPPPVG